MWVLIKIPELLVEIEVAVEVMDQPEYESMLMLWEVRVHLVECKHGSNGEGFHGLWMLMLPLL